MANDYEETLLEKYREKFKAMAKIINNMAKEINRLDVENNALRYERLMAKAAYFRSKSVNYDIYRISDSKANKCHRIAEAYEARAKRIKEQM